MKPLFLVVALSFGPLAGLPAYAAGPGPDAFVQMDANKDGKVTQEEFTAQRSANQALVDSDADGFVSAGEMRATLESNLDQMVAKRMARLDADGDGKLSVSETASGPSAQKIFARLDRDGDGAVSLAEADAMHAMMEERLGRLANKCSGADD